MKKSTNLIYYYAGCYGTFIEWLCTASYNNTLSQSPFLNDGSSHKFSGNNLYPPEKLFKYINSQDNFLFARTVPGIFEQTNSHDYIKENSFNDTISRELEHLINNFNKILVLYPTLNTKLWIQNNMVEKVVITEEYFEAELKPYGYTREFLSSSFKGNQEKIIDIVKNEIKIDNLSAWGKKSLEDFEHWELRELLSFYWFNRDKDLYTCWDTLQQKFDSDSIKFISMDDLYQNAVNASIESLEFLGLDNLKTNQITEILHNWEKLQTHKNKDKIVNDIIKAVLNNEEYSWHNIKLSIIDESYIQKILRDNGVELKCYKLNNFPSDSRALIQLTERMV